MNIIKQSAIRIFMVIFWIGAILSSLYFFDYLFSSLSKRSINVLVWSGMLDSNYIAKFEKETNIRVNLSYFENNEELIVKLRATKGKGYDLIVPSDYAISILKEDNLLKKLDKSKLNFLDNLNPVLLNHYFDEHNEYSIPAEWAVFGLGIDKSSAGRAPKNSYSDINSWELIFNPKTIKSKIVMSNDYLVSIPLAAIYLFKSLKNIDTYKLVEIKNLLLQQKPFVEAYTDSRPDYYVITNNVPIAVASSSYMIRSMREYPNLDFIIPKEGTLVTIESYAIPQASNKDDLVYEFLNFMFRPETVKHHFEKLGIFPTIKNVLPELNLTGIAKYLLTISQEEFNKFNFLRFNDFKR